jgi:two-component system sensor histidine kinase YesM
MTYTVLWCLHWNITGWGEAMEIKRSIFGKFITLLVALLIPVLLLYSYSNRVSVQVVEEQIKTSNLNQLSYFTNQIDKLVEQLMTFSIVLSQNPEINEFNSNFPQGGLIDKTEYKNLISRKLSLQSISSRLTNEITFYAPNIKEVVSSKSFKEYDEEYLKKNVSLEWKYRVRETRSGLKPEFVKFIVDPFSAYQNLEKARTIFEISFTTDNIENLLTEYKTGKAGDPFFYTPGVKPVLNKTANRDMITKLIGIIAAHAKKTNTSEIIEIDHKSYVVFYFESAQLGWTLVDYIPLENIISPINSSRNLFYFSVGLLLLLGLLSAFLLYRQVQVPIRKLISGVQHLKKGDFTARIQYKSNNEFNYLFDKFNEMVEEIQELIEKVYKEKIRSREATLKQLQSQINPHFLYNSLGFIINMSKLEDSEAVTAMAYNLSEYYQYTTYIDEQKVELSYEIRLIGNYLEVYKLRLPIFEYSISLPDEMLASEVPRLILQPIVENGVKYGIQKRLKDGVMKISGFVENNKNHVIIEENGPGLAQEAIDRLNDDLNGLRQDNRWCGMLNVSNRLKYMFGEESGLRISRSELGGLKVELVWTEGEEHGAIADR